MAEQEQITLLGQDATELPNRPKQGCLKAAYLRGLAVAPALIVVVVMASCLIMVQRGFFRIPAAAISEDDGHRVATVPTSRFTSLASTSVSTLHDNDTQPGDCPALSVLGTGAAPQPSDSCKASNGLCKEVKKPVMESIEVFDAELGITVTRRYAILVPESACNPKPGESAPLLLWFHGQTGDSISEANVFARSSGLRSCSLEHGWISVFPMGLGLADDAEALGVPVPTPSKGKKALRKASGPPVTDMGTGWNVGVAGDSSTCLTELDQSSFPQPIKPTEYSCYPSCQAKGQCGRCNWSTCHDDIAFVKTLLKHLQQKYCIDRSRIYLGGTSNGGMFAHYVSQAIPGVFAAMSPLYGLPLIGYGAGRHGEIFRHRALNIETAILAFHDRQDRIIPLHGGLSPMEGWGWYYTPLNEVMSHWATVHDCDQEPVDITHIVKASCPHIPTAASCHEHLNCRTRRRVLFCTYDGQHGSIPENQFFGCASVWFLNQFRRTSPVILDD